VLNGDDPNVVWMATQTRARVRTFGFAEGLDVRASDVVIDWPHGMRFTLETAGERRHARVRLLGRHMIYPVLAAVMVALAQGVRLDEALSALEALPPTPGRLETVPLPNGAFVVRDEHKATLETVEAALDLLAEIPAHRRIVVLGDAEELNESPPEVYARLGARVASVATAAAFVHLGEKGPRYAGAAERGGMPAEAVTDADGAVLGAAEAVRGELRRGDVVLVKGARAQRLDRVSLALAGRAVRCELLVCQAKATRCDECPMLERGWAGRARAV
jgi:UDP-N-acetylmuramoyl-tripeptide--D-alanyl-D-alanine ligase